MENIPGFGFRFHPTDEELITHYLSKKVSDGNFNARAIGEVALNNEGFHPSCIDVCAHISRYVNGLTSLLGCPSQLNEWRNRECAEIFDQVQNWGQQINDQALVNMLLESQWFTLTSILLFILIIFMQVRCEYNVANFSTGDRMRRPKGDRFVFLTNF
ncbi:hypothetical protein Sjap_008273 [Stephania japonica]|uniref:NAC domain-containing protein n=1 Tax=Stephania japonica TaxID=461633 RepID=A0AAP0PC56_9MAGN